MSEVAIKFENISKQYRLGLVGTGTIKDDLNRWWHTIRGKEDPYLKIGEVNDRSAKANGKYVWALKDISFDVKQGEVIGIIGKNGAGKSTLLKLLSRVTTPSTGYIKAKGRIASLLEVGTGFHPELTGRENIYMNGSIMGMTKAEITRKLDEIIAFAGVEKYIDTPSKRYSSGMTVRLGFAIAAHLEPEILVVDEVLAVGDAEFQRKAIGKMQDVSRTDGRTVLFVSHNMGAVKSLCNRGVILNNGQVDYISENIHDALAKYIDFKEDTAVVPMAERKDRSGNGKIFIKSLEFLNGISPTSINIGEQIQLKINYEAKVNDFVGKFYVSINDNYGQCVLFLDSSTIPEFPFKLERNGNIIISISNDFNLPEGKYFVNIASFIDDEMADYIQNALIIEVNSGDFFFAGKTPAGRTLCYVKQNWKVEYE